MKIKARFTNATLCGVSTYFRGNYTQTTVYGSVRYERTRRNIGNGLSIILEHIDVLFLDNLWGSVLINLRVCYV